MTTPEQALDNLPPLPEPEHDYITKPGFTANQMREYALAAIANVTPARAEIKSAWCAGYYHAGYTHDQSYADEQSEKYAAHDANSVTQPASAAREDLNFCQRCGKRCGPADHIHTCTPPVDDVVRIDLEEEEVARIRAYIGEEDERPITFLIGDWHSGYGIYVGDTEYLDEGIEFIKAMQAKEPK